METSVQSTGSTRPKARTSQKGYLEVFPDYVDKPAIQGVIREAFLDGIELIAGRESREGCEREGLEAMHRHFPYENLGMLEPYILGRIKESVLRWTAELGRKTLNLQHEFFVQDLLLLRINYPYYPYVRNGSTPSSASAPALRHRMRYGLRNVAASAKAAVRSGTMIGRPRDMFSYYVKRGKVKGVAYRGHPSHIDSWFGQPIRSLSVWLSIAGVDRANSMCLYPETDGIRMPQNSSLYLGTGFRLPKPTRPDLTPGDLLVFTTDMLHCTQLNVSEKTRIAITARVSAETPAYNKDNLWFIEEWHSSNDLINGRIKRPSSCGSRRVAVDDDLDAPWEHTTSVRVSSRFDAGVPQPIMASESLQDGEKVAVEFDNARFVVLRTSGKLTALSGTCPHAGYRMADGYHDERQITCPGHGLEFDLETGQSRIPCFSLSKERVYERDGTIFLG